MIKPAFSPSIPVIPVGLANFSRLVHTGTPLKHATTGQSLISDLAEVMKTVCVRAEAMARNFDPGTDDSDAAGINAVENRLLGVHDTLASLDIPECLEWTDLGHDIAALSPPALRAGAYYVGCNAPQGSGVMMGIIMWKYLALRFAFHNAAQRRRGAYALATAYECFESSRQAVVSAAKGQRKVLGHMDLDREKLNGQYIALTIRKQALQDDDAYLFAINDLGEGSFACNDLVLRATAALRCVDKPSINHAIILSDSLNNPAETNDVHFPLTGVHVLGHSDQIRYVFVVSSVSDHIASEPAEDESGSTVAVSRARLRDAFWRRRSASDRSIGDGKRPSVHFGTADELPAMQVLVRKTAKELHTHVHKVIPESNAVSVTEPLVSRVKAARAFFGYKGLKTSLSNPVRSS